jgi:hypothetical protein
MISKTTLPHTITFRCLPTHLILNITIVLFTCSGCFRIDQQDNKELRIDNLNTIGTDDVVLIEVPVVAEKGKDDYACLNTYYEQDIGIKLIMALWPNGRIVWSQDILKGDTPNFKYGNGADTGEGTYFESWISKDKIRHVLNNLAVYGVYQNIYPQCYPHQPYNAFNICDRERKRVAMIVRFLNGHGYNDAGLEAGIHGITNAIYSLIPSSGTNIHFQYEYSFIKYRLRWCPLEKVQDKSVITKTNQIEVEKDKKK